MKLHVADYRKVNNGVYVNGYSVGYNYKKQFANVRFSSDVWDNYVKKNPLKFPIVLDVKFEKGKGAYLG